MQRSYIVRRAVNYADFNFFIKAGDILVHDPSNGNRLAVYRGGEIVKVFTQTAIGIAAMVKNGYIAEAPARPAAAPKKATDAARTPPTSPSLAPTSPSLGPTSPSLGPSSPSKPAAAAPRPDAKAKRGKAAPKDPLPEIEDESI